MAMRFERRQDEEGVTLLYRPWAGGEPVELRCERELPERMLAERARERARTSEKQRRRRRRRVVVGTCLLGVLICLGLGIWYMVWSHQSSDYGYWDGDYPPYGEDYYWDTGEFSQLETTIERYPTGDDVRLTLVADHAAEPLTAGEIYEKVNPAVVTVLGEQGPTYSVGTGVIFSEDGYIITNYHVISGCSACVVWVTDSYGVDTEYEARLVGYDEDNDLAVLKIDAIELPVAEFGVSDDLQVGDRVYAIGNPLGLELRNTLTDGLVSAIDRDVDVDGVTMTLIQTNAALNSGNSGGPLINCYGQVIGINTMKIGAFTDSAGVEGLGFAIPSSTVKEVAEQLISQGYVSGRPTLGLEGESLSSFDQYYYRLPAGLYITNVDRSSDAAAKGIEEGDILLSVNGTNVTTMDALNGAVYNLDVGDTVEVVIYRSGKQYRVSLTVTEDKG